MLFALPGAPECGRNRVMLKALCPPFQPQAASAPYTAIKQRLLGSSNPSALFLVFWKVSVRLKLQTFQGIFQGMKLEMLLTHRQWVQVFLQQNIFSFIFSFHFPPLLCLVWSSCTPISLVSLPVFSLKIHRTDVAVSWVIFKFPREKRGEKVETCFFCWGRGTSDGKIVLSTAWIVYTGSILLMVSWHYILFC